MNRNRLYKLLALEAVICVVFVIVGWRFNNVFTSVMAFPFEQIGFGLRALSLGGSAGNVVSVVLYAVICLLPAGYAVYRSAKWRMTGEDVLLLLCSALLFAVMYFMINPGFIGTHFGSAEFADAGKGFLGSCVYSVIIGYVVLRIVRRIPEGNTGRLLFWLQVLLQAMCAFLVIYVFGTGLVWLLEQFGLFRSQNTDSGPHALSYVFMTLQYAVAVLPAALQLWILHEGLGLVEALREDAYSDAVVESSVRLGRRCRNSVIAMMGSQIALNVLQLMAGSAIRVMTFNVDIPLGSIAFALAAMLAAKYFEKGKELKDDNDMFV